MKIELTNFSKRHFDIKFSGTKILDRTPEQFEIDIKSKIESEEYVMEDGYADFCKLLFIKNWTNSKTGTITITEDNSKYLRTGYIARTENELPVLSRWFDIPNELVPVANYLVLVLYTRSQLEQEHLSTKTETPFELSVDTDYGVVAILAQMKDKEEPMTPMTMMRNALGKEEGGSGIPLDKIKYIESVDFWAFNSNVK